MIAGFLAFGLFIAVCLRVVDKRLRKKRGVISKMHAPISCALIAAGMLHAVMTLPLFRSRPVLVPVATFDVVHGSSLQVSASPDAINLSRNPSSVSPHSAAIKLLN